MQKIYSQVCKNFTPLVGVFFFAQKKTEKISVKKFLFFLENIFRRRFNPIYMPSQMKN